MTILSLLFGLSTAHAVPVQLNQQGRLLDTTGAGVTGVHTLTFKLFDAQFGGNALWQDNVQTVFDNGYYAALLGGNPSNLLDDSVLSTGSAIFLEIEVDGGGPIGARQEVVSSPYARRAGIAESISGGSVDASSLSVDGQLVIDAAGSWVGPALAVNWGDVQGVPADIADGDDDTLAGINCSTGEILGWNGSQWACTADNGLTEAEVEAFVTNGPLDLDAATTIGGLPILTQGDGDTLSGLSCQSGDVAKYDAALGWQCEVDLDTNTADWSLLNGIPADIADGDGDTLSGLACQNGDVAKYDAALGWQCDVDLDSNSADWSVLSGIPADIADGDDNTQLSDADVIGIVESNGINLQVGSALNGVPIMSSGACNNNEFVVYKTATQSWECSSLTATLDSDSDGHLAWNDCDDNDPSVGSKITDQDCDGIQSADDCDDFDPASTSIATDADCDGLLTADDCDDNNSNANAVINDGDCDGTLTADDCDDTDPSVSLPGSGQACPLDSCLDILQSGYSTGDGDYWIQTASLGTIPVYCDMSFDGGGWTLCYDNAEAYDNTIQVTDWHIRNNTTALGSGTYSRHCQNMTADLSPAVARVTYVDFETVIATRSAPALTNGNYYEFSALQGGHNIGIEIHNPADPSVGHCFNSSLEDNSWGRHGTSQSCYLDTQDGDSNIWYSGLTHVQYFVR